MPRFHATANGNVQFTPEEEAEWDAMQADHAAGETQRQRDSIQAQIDAMEHATMLNRGSRELELVSMRDLAARQAAVLQSSMPDKSVEEITAGILVARPYYTRLAALEAQVEALRAAMEAL